jgi:two-component system, OmpR family, sensor histidine kinase KdpD
MVWKRMAQADSRPNPDELLARVKADEAKVKRGRLKIFLGYAAGVGKTYAMLEYARQRKSEKDVAIAYVETHGRKETESLLEGLEIIPRMQVEYKGVVLPEMDLDAVLSRRPDLAVVDEYAHTNTPGSRHEKRYQDVEELLDAGIDVYTTLNIQHVESLRSVVAQVTDVWMRETVPDSAVDLATDIELVDLPPDELIKRLQEGKVYVPDQIASAISQFFRKGNLGALRELAMRTAAQRVDEQLRTYMEEKSIRGPWPTGERLLVWISPDSASANLVRAARRLAAQLGAEWFAVNIETPDSLRILPRQRDSLTAALQLAEKLGARIVTLQERNVPSAIDDFARSHDITKIVVGHAPHPRWQEWLHGSVINQIIRQNRDLDIHIIRSQAEPGEKIKEQTPQFTRRARNLLLALILIGAATGLSELLRNTFDSINLLMFYLLSTAIAAIYLGLGPSILVSVLGVLVFDFLFIPPYLSFAVADTRFFFSLIAFMAVGIVISYLTSQFRRQTEAAWQSERQISALYSLGRDLAISNDLESYIKAILKRTKDTFENDAIIFLPDPQNKESLKSYTNSPDLIIAENDNAAALWAFQHQKIIGHGTDTLPNAGARYFPLTTARGIVGILALVLPGKNQSLTLEQERLIEAYSDLAGVAIEGILLTQETRNTEVLIASEKLQTALLDSISHDLRTPLVSVIGALSSLQEAKIKLDEDSIRKLVAVAREEAERLNHLITNLLDESRLEAGAIKVNRQPSEVQDLVGAALEQIGARSSSHEIKMNLPADLPFVSVDFGLIVQALINILDNAIKYSPAGSALDIKGYLTGNTITIEVADRGIGIPTQDLDHVFDKFFRVHRPDKVKGTGLGLSISRGIVEAHGGRIIAENRPDGGTIIRLNLPLAESSAKDRGQGYE